MDVITREELVCMVRELARAAATSARLSGQPDLVVSNHHYRMGATVN